MSNTHDFKRGDLLYVNGLPAVVYYVSPLQMRVLMLKRGDLKTYRINRDKTYGNIRDNRIELIKASNEHLKVDSIMDFLHKIGVQNET
mgnify:CR=1 FL=1